MILKEYNYSKPRQRLYITINTFFSALLVGLLLANVIFLAKQLLFYGNITISVSLLLMTILLAGNLTGKMLFNLVSGSRIVYIVSETVFIISSGLYLLRGIIFRTSDLDIIFSSLNAGIILPAALVIIPFFTAGIKLNYFLKICSGLFIDEKQGISQFIFAIISGVLAGISLYILDYRYNFPYESFSAVLLFILPFVFLIREKYSPQNFIANTVAEEGHNNENEDKRDYRDDVFFTYLNFSCIIIYMYLGYITVRKFINPSLNTSVLFIFLSFLSILAGYLFSTLVKKSFWHIYSEMFYPFIFFVFFLLLYNFPGAKNSPAFMLFFMPVGFISGFTIFHSLKSILNRYNHKNSYTVINISFFILPLPILISLTQITFTYRWFFIIFYSVAFLNMVFPGIHLTQRKIREYKKGIYFIVLFITIPLFIFSHMYFRIHPDNSLFISNTGNFDSIYNINYNSDYISDSFTVTVNDRPAAEISDGFYHDLKQSLAALDIFMNGDSSKILFVDGYRKFLFNTGYRFFKNSILLDYVPRRTTDFHNLPISGEKEIITVNRNIYSYLHSERKNVFDGIVLIPNMLDQTDNAVIFSNEFFRLLKSRIKPGGSAAVILDIEKTDKRNLNSCLYSMKTEFKKTVVLNFASQLVIISSDDDNAFKINGSLLRQTASVVSKTSPLFYDEIDLFSFITVSDFSKIEMTRTEIPSWNRIFSPSSENFTSTLQPGGMKIGSYPHTAFLDMAGSNEIRENLKAAVKSNGYIYDALFSARSYNLAGKYSEELSSYTSLLKPADRVPELKKYINYVLQIKKLNYSSLAEISEKNKDWDKAKELYNSILAIEPDNFNAIYNLSIISITIQDLDKAFEFLTRALELNRTNTDVMYHMGVLLFAKQDYKKSQYYLNLAVDSNRSDAMTFFYLGMTYEQMGEYTNFLNARKNYKIALSKNPNNDDINAAYYRNEETIKGIESGWTDRGEQKNGDTAEQVPLPVTEKALNSRLTDE